MRIIRTLVARLPLVALACAAALAGCSAIQVDVDVYKGPLVNEQEIQLRQFAALAIAAKPMLASVRNELEAAAGGDGRLGDDYQDAHHFRSELAHFVNGSMSYYGDLGTPEELKVMRGEAKAIDGLAAFDYRALDVSLAKEIDAGPAAHFESGPDAREFANQYHLLLCGTEVGMDCPSPGVGIVLTGSDRKSDKFQKACIKAMAANDRTCPRTPRSNSLFATLADTANVTAHAEKLLPEGHREKFVARILEMSRAYLQAREGMREVFEGSIALLEAPPGGADSSATAVRKAAPQVLAYSMQPRTLTCLLTTPNADRVKAAWDALPEEPKKLLLASPIASHIKGPRVDEKWEIETYSKADAALAEAARVAPVSIAVFLRVVHHEAVMLPEEDVCRCSGLIQDDADHVSPDSARTYGLASGPTMASSFDKDFQNLQKSLGPIRAAAAAGFDRARLPDGIESLTQEFLQALDENNHHLDSEAVQKARQRLEEALIFFAERMLFVINNVTRSAIESDIGGKWDTTNEATAVRNEGVHAYSGSRADGVARLQSRVAVLQSLGNSLVLQANDLRRQLNHAEQQKSRYEGELEATRRALNPGAPAVLDALMMQAKAQLAQKTRGAARAAGEASAASAGLTDADQALLVAQDALKRAQDPLTIRESAYKPLEAFVRTYIPAPARAGLYAIAPSDAVAEGADQKRLRQSLVEAFPTANNVKASDYLKAIRAWVKLTASGLGGTGPRFDRLTSTLSYLDDSALPLTDDALAPASAHDLAKKISELLLDWANDQSAQLVKLAGSRNAAQVKVDAVNKVVVAAKKRSEKKVAASPAKEGERQKAERVMALLDARRGDVLRDASRENAKNPSSVLALLRKEVAAMDKSDDRQSALDFLDGFQPSTVVSYSLPQGWAGKTPTDVYDQLIAQLRQERIQAELGGFTAQSAHIQSAINLAYEARAGVAFLRPASDYLKNVYSSTNLQDAQDPAQENLLNAWWKRLLPAGDDKYEREARRQTEKLYWQNINRVSLSGGGSTNYVIAKDDIGNWYVKAYSANPESIIKSAQSLALFGTGQKLNVNLLNRLDIQRQLAKETNSTERDKLRGDLNRNAADGNASLLKVRDRYTTQYATSLQQTFDSLHQVVDGMADGAWHAVDTAIAKEDTKPDQAAFADALTTQLAQTTTALGGVHDALKVADTDATRLGKIEDALFQTFDALRRFRQASYSKIGSSATTVCAGNQATCTKAAGIVQGYVIDKLNPIVAQHRAAVASYDNALFNLEDIASSK
jgi:hypothetical protein